MKTRHTLLYLLTTLLSVCSIQTSHAQAEQDALYIFRNDGQFNAFFYGDIDRIEYSKVDTLGIEHDDYVTQEVWALDTVYRIPINAIDSVAFVTPETKIKADVFYPDKSIVDYIVASDSVYWIRLAKNTPASLIPKVGDKLLIEEESLLIPDGFGGLVTSVEEGSDGFTVMTSALALTDIYEQLVVKVAGASPGMKPTEVRRRKILEGTDIAVPEQEISIPSVSQTISLKNSTAFLPDNSYVELNGDVQGSLSMSVSPKIRLRAFFTITPFTGFRYIQETFIDTETETAATLTGGLSGRLEVPFLPSPTHTFKKGKLKFELGIGLFLEAQATALSLGFKNNKVQKTRVNITFDHNDIGTSITGAPVFNPFIRWKGYCEKDTTEWDFNCTGQYSLGFGAFAKAEAKFSVPIEKLPKFVQAWTDKKELGFKATLGLDVGTKTEYAGPLSLTVPELLQTPPFYTELNKANLSVSAYLKFVAAVNCGSLTGEYAPEIKFWEPINRGLVPDILGIGVTQDREEPIRPYRLLFKSPTSDKKIFIGTKVGFAVLDADDKLVTDTLSAYYWISSNEDEWIWNDNKSSYDCVIKLDPGKDDYVTYRAYPMVQFMGGKVLVDQMKEFKLDPARIDIAEREIFLGKDLGYREIEVVPNMENMEVKAEADWLNATKPIWLAHKNELTIYWPDLPGDVKDRRGVIRLIGKSQKGETLVEDSIVVVQFEPFMELTPDKLEFDKKGGTKTITIGKTNVTNLAVSTSTEDITAVLEGKTVTVTMGENTSEEERGGSVYVEGKTPEGKTVKFFVTVTQEGGDPKENKDNKLKLSTYYVEISAAGSKQTPSVEEVHIAIDPETVKQIQNLECTSDADFVDAYYRSLDEIIIASLDNTTLNERIATVTVTATLKDGSILTATITVKQKSYWRIRKFVIDSECVWKYTSLTGDVWTTQLDDYERPGWTFDEDNPYNDKCDTIIATKLDNGSIHVEGLFERPSQELVVTASFDLPNGFESTVVNNIKLHYTCKYGDDGIITRDLDASNVPFDHIYDSGHGYPTIYWKGTVADGVVINECNEKFHNIKGWPDYYYVDNGQNNIKVIVDYTTIPDE